MFPSSPKISIIITNHNYARFLKEAIESALNQDDTDVEVIVVDDGSTDNSREIIRSYGYKIIAIFQENKGHISATNAGFAKSTGDLITFLDADDYLFSNMCCETSKLFNDNVAKVHYKIVEVDQYGKELELLPRENETLSEGPGVYKEILSGDYVTSLGNIYNKKLVSNLFPLPHIKTLPDDNYLNTVTPDSYLNPRVPFCGEVAAINKALAAYRKHGENYGASKNPYKSYRKRQRYLVKTKIDTEFLIEEAEKRNIKFNKDIRFKRYEIIRLRMISLRIDNPHPFPCDTRFSILKLAIRHLRYKPKISHIRNIYYILFIIAVAFLPKSILMKQFNGVTH